MARSVKVVIHQGVVDEVNRLLDKEVGKIADDILTESQAIVPVRTGHLRDSGFTESDAPGVWTIGFEAEYAADVELGSRGRSPRPYLMPAASKKRG